MSFYDTDDDGLGYRPFPRKGERCRVVYPPGAKGGAAIPRLICPPTRRGKWDYGFGDLSGCGCEQVGATAPTIFGGEATEPGGSGLTNLLLAAIAVILILKR